MKKTLLALSLISVSNFSSAIQGGVSVNTVDHPSLVEMNCTGTIIGGMWVLTAAHCSWETAGGLRPVNLLGSTMNQSHTANTLEMINHPQWEIDKTIDIGLWKLAGKPDVNKINFLSMSPISIDDNITIFGFGQTRPILNYAIQKIIPLGMTEDNFSSLNIGKGDTQSGDSGGPVFNDNNLIVGVTQAGNAQNTGSVTARLNMAHDFILSTINGWHYPTLANTSTTGGSVTIEVQSLHADSVIDNATASGDATITGGTCSGATVQPYDICTYTVASNGYEGTVTLDGDQKITINKGRTKPVTPPTPEPEQGSSGGALGSLGLLFGVILGFTRRKTTR